MEVCACQHPASWRDSGDSSVQSADSSSLCWLYAIQLWQSGRKVRLLILRGSVLIFDDASDIVNKSSFLSAKPFLALIKLGLLSRMCLPINLMYFSHYTRLSRLPGGIPRWGSSCRCSQGTWLGLSFQDKRFHCCLRAGRASPVSAAGIAGLHQQKEMHVSPGWGRLTLDAFWLLYLNLSNCPKVRHFFISYKPTPCTSIMGLCCFW